MVIGERIAERLSAVGISQAELARRVGISQQAVGKLVHGESRKTSHIVRMARALSTTPAFLEGETDDPDQGASEARPLDADTSELVENVRAMSAADRRALLQIARSMAANSAGSTVHVPPGAASRATGKGR